MGMFKGMPGNEPAKQSTSATPPSGGGSRYGELMEGAGERYGVPPGLMSQLMSKETGGEADPATATSSKGAYGIGQVLPSTARDMGYTDEQMQDPAYQAEASAKYLRQMYDRYGTWGDALQAYHDGPGNHDKNRAGTRTPGPEGAQYVDERFDAYTGGDEPVQHATSAKKGGMFKGMGGAAPAAAAPNDAQQPAAPEPTQPDAAAPQTPQQPASAPQSQPFASLYGEAPAAAPAPAGQQAASAPFAALYGEPTQPAPQPDAVATTAQPTAPAQAPQQPGTSIGDMASSAFNTVGEVAAGAGRAIINAGVNVARPVWNWAAGNAESQIPQIPGQPQQVIPRISADQDKAIGGLEKMIGAQPGSLHTQGVAEDVAAEILPYFVGPGELKALEKVPGAARFVVNSLLRNATGSMAQAGKGEDAGVGEFLKNEAYGLAGDAAFKGLGKVLKPAWESAKAGLGFGKSLANETERTIGKAAEEAASGNAKKTEIPQRPTAENPTPEAVQTNDAVERLAKNINVDKRVVHAAEQLDMADKLTPAHYDLNPATREVASRLQAVPESVMGHRNKEAVAALSEHADDLIHVAGGTRDKVQLSQKFKDESYKAIDELGAKADEQYSEIRKLIPEGTDVNASDTLAHLNHLSDTRRIELSTAEKKALKRLTPETDEAGNITKRPSYDALDQMRKEVGQAINQKSGPFKDEEVGSLKQLYRHLTADQEAAAVAHGAGDAWNVGKALVAQRKTLEDSLENVIGKSGGQQATAKYGAAIKKLGKGDVGDFDQLIKDTPQHLRSSMVATALNDAMTTGANKGADLNVPTFLKWYDGAQKSGALGRVMAHIDPPSRARLRNIATVARGLNRGNQYNISNGSINAFINRFNAGDSPIGKLFGHALTGAGAAGGWVMGGPIGAAVGAGLAKGGQAVKSAATKAQNARVSAADEVLSDPHLLDVLKASAYRSEQGAAAAERIRNGTATADDLANEGLVRKAERKLAGSPAWQKLMATLPKTEREDLKKYGAAQWLAGYGKAEATNPDEE